MRHIERAEERGKSELGWLHSRFTYSFAEYTNPARMGFGALRVVNDDIVDSNSGFPLHHHEQMEIITVMRKGELTHQDSIGNSGVLRANDVQVMTAGTGINHSEWNHGAEKAELFQIWMFPKVRALMPSYEQASFDPLGRKNAFQVLAAGIKKEGALFIHQDASVSRATLEAGRTLSYELQYRTHGVFLMLVSGDLTVGSDALKERDSMEITGETSLQLATVGGADVLLLEVPM